MRSPPKFKSISLFRDDFEELDDLPNESTLETNVTHKKLNSFEQLGWETVALSPTRFSEGNISGGGPLGKGYDITFDEAHEIVFQHKAPKKTVVRGEDNRNKRLWLQYNIDFAQLLNLAVQYQPRQAYLTLPVVPQQNLLGKSLHMSLFIDVWTLYSGIREYGLCPDYILVEFLPDWRTGLRPPYDMDGQLSPREYFQQQPAIKCKHKCNKWGMEATGPDPYLELSLGDSVFAQVVHWGPLRETFHERNLGLEITSNLRPDGGDPLPEGWPQVELHEEYSREYREHIKRRYALSRLGDQYDEPDSESVLQWILDDLSTRYEQAVQREMITPLNSQEAESGLIEDVYEYETSSRDILESFVNRPNPEMYRLEDTSRHVLQSGKEREVSLKI